MSEKCGGPLPKFGEWDVNNPASAEGFTVIFNKARDEKKTGTNDVQESDSPLKKTNHYKNISSYSGTTKSASKKWFCCMGSTEA